jgi:dolichyl-phosphate beta-glucosyltransferase
VPESAADSRLCLIVPCFNEAQRLPVHGFAEWIGAGCGQRLIFVDDGSSDGTAELLQRFREGKNGCVSVLSLPSNKGKAEAVRAGTLYALDEFQPAFVGFWDADLATPLDATEHFLSVFRDRLGIEMVFGSRVQLLGRRVERRPTRHYLGRVFATVVSTMLRLPIYDTQCGAKIFRVRPHTRAVFAEPFLSKWVFDVEIIARYLQVYGRDAKRLEQIIYEYPLETWIDIAGSKVRPGDFLSSLSDVLRIYRRYLS